MDDQDPWDLANDLVKGRVTPDETYVQIETDKLSLSCVSVKNQAFIWQLTHTDGQIQPFILPIQEFDPEKERLIHIADCENLHPHHKCYMCGELLGSSNTEVSEIARYEIKNVHSIRTEYVHKDCAEEHRTAFADLIEQLQEHTDQIRAELYSRTA